MWKITFKASLVTIAVILVTQVVSFSIRHSAGQSFTAFVFAMNSILPVLTAFPAAFLIFWQNEKLSRALAELSQAHMQLKAKATHDHMTGLLKREAFFEKSKQARRKCDSGALLLIDADNFKSINDTFGHLVGDEALKLISKALRSAIRENDLVGRVGGEEFCAFLPTTGPDEAAAVAERIRVEVERLAFYPVEGRPHRLTVSIGAVVSAGQQPTSQLMRLADRCLYEAKEQGRNRVVFASPVVPVV
ncbi:GGDEF domain-containing protein [Aminobacter sp. MDW-2]|uniref:GGDEF domain-containing protein n=1 Tax=Aminobacter sp. MDW-2 TaxID=2666139 RepID=UPI001310B34F|nr:GGDEF domain-containing protein [Aminobacter sp. MDW-2]MRX32044.1 diguanylate cyclase [Aminobacter sp. MDW-2]QNH32507.1 GGDEF domain-containing protein [Aminobacter sp. MDW-2]